MHEVKIYMYYLTYRGKETTQKSHEKDECVEFQNVN
jgi:hypothetical protein